MYSFPHEYIGLTHVMIAETPALQGVQQREGVGHPARASTPWKFELNMSNERRIVYTDPVQIVDDVQDTPVLVMADCSAEEAVLRETTAKQRIVKAYIDRAWQRGLVDPLTRAEYDGERILEPPTDVVDVLTDGDGITVFNFSRSSWGEEDRHRVENTIDAVVNNGEAKRLYGCATIWVMEGDGVRLSHLKEAGEQHPIVMSERLFQGTAGFLASVIAPYVSVRSERSDQITSVNARRTIYEKPWGLPKPDLITLL